MEVIKENAATLSNYEVYKFLQDIQAGRGQKKPGKNQQNLSTITYETIKYIETTPCSVQSPEIIKQFMKEMEPYNLTKSEKLLILNQRPTTAVEIQLSVEESEERVTEDKIYELLDIVAKILPDPSGGEEDDEPMEDNGVAS